MKNRKRERKFMRLVMDKLLLSLFLVVLLTSLTVNSAPMPGSKLISSIDLRHKKLSASAAVDNGDDDDGSIKVESAESNRMKKLNKMTNQMSRYADSDTSENENDDSDERRRMFIRHRDAMLGETGLRRNKMVGFYPFNALPFGDYSPYTTPVFYPSEFYEDFDAFYSSYVEDEEIMSRQNPGSRRRPGSASYKNSPIFYIRLPPTPYMFVPGLGYISQPPSYQPMTPVPQPISPFYNLPLDFISNGKPTNIYQWGSPSTQFNPQPQYVQQPPQFGSYPQYQRPQRPYTQRPINQINPYLQESKVTNLKGPFLFNGRPEEIFLLQNSYNPLFSDPRLSAGYF